MADRAKDMTGLSLRGWLIVLPLAALAGWVLAELALKGGAF